MDWQDALEARRKFYEYLNRLAASKGNMRPADVEMNHDAAMKAWETFDMLARAELRFMRQRLFEEIRIETP